MLLILLAASSSKCCIINSLVARILTILFQALLLEDKRPLDGYGTSGQPNGALIEWPFEAKNQLFYDRAGLQLSETEKSEQVHVRSASHMHHSKCMTLPRVLAVQHACIINLSTSRAVAIGSRCLR